MIIGQPVQQVAKVYRTLGELRMELQDRLGGASQGQNAGVKAPVLNSMLRSAQKSLYLEFDWQTLIRYQDVTLGANAIRIDYPTFMDAERLIQIGVKVSNSWQEVKRGITLTMYTTQDNPSYPVRFEEQDQIEFWPRADQSYLLRVWGIKALPRFTEDQDRAIIDDDLVFLWALATAKAHWGHKDAQAVGNQVEQLRVKLRSKSWKKRVYDANVGQPIGPDWEPLAKPVVLGR